jgi:tetratricopeptide (TPR) repeat protein
VSPGWADIGLGAITDIVQHAFGPVDLDRSPVELATTAKPILGCPACGGRRLGFPAGLAEAQSAMCPTHHREAQAVINWRFARANASNPDGWGALTDASERLGRPNLPNGLAGKLAGADQAMYVLPDPGVLAERARLVVEAAGWFKGRPADLAMALGQEPSLAGMLPDWLRSLVFDLGRAGLGAEAAEVGDAIGRVDPDLRASLAADVAVALAEAGLADEARARIAANLTTWPGDFWVRLHAGDALAVLGDLDGAEAHFTEALTMADDADDFEARSDAADRLRRLDRTRRGDPPSRPNGQRRQPRKLSRAQRKRRR